jgi:hypothetical protein
VTVESIRVLLEAVRVIIEVVRKITEAVRLFVKAVRVILEAIRALRSSAIKSIPIDPRLRNNFLHFRFDPLKFRAIVCFASSRDLEFWTNLIRFCSILESFGLTQFVFVRSWKVLD